MGKPAGWHGIRKNYPHWSLIIFHLFYLCFSIRFGVSPVNRADAGRARGSAARNQGFLLVARNLPWAFLLLCFCLT